MVGDEKSHRGVARTVLAAIATLAVLGLVAWKVSPGPIADALVSSHWLWVAVAASVALLFNTVQSAEVLRWTLLGFGESISHRMALAATAGNMAIKAALPAGSGELGRVVWLERTCGVPALRSAAAIGALLWFKLLWLHAMAIVGWLLTQDRHVLQGVLVISSALVLLGLPVVAIALGRSSALREEPRPGWRGIPRALVQTLAHVRPGALAAGALHALLAVAAELAVFALLLHAAGGRVDPVEILAFMPIVIVGAKIPATVLGLGTREGLVLILMTGAGAAPVVTAAAVLFSMVEYVLPAIVGAALTWSYVRRILGG